MLAYCHRISVLYTMDCAFVATVSRASNHLLSSVRDVVDPVNACSGSFQTKRSCYNASSTKSWRRQ